jgi:flagellar hook-length control protein FliK
LSLDLLLSARGVAAPSARPPGTAGASTAPDAPSFSAALSAAGSREGAATPSDASPSDASPSDASPREPGAPTALGHGSTPSDDPGHTESGPSEALPRLAAPGRARAPDPGRAQAARATRGAARGTDGEPSSGAAEGVRAEAPVRDLAPATPSDAPRGAAPRRVPTDGADDASSRPALAPPDADRPAGLATGGPGVPPDPAVAGAAPRATAGTGRRPPDTGFVDAAVVDTRAADGGHPDDPTASLQTGRPGPAGSGPASARTGNPRAAGAHGAGRDAASGRDAVAAPPSPGAGLAEVARSIGEPWRSAASERPAEAVPNGAPPALAGIATSASALHGEAPATEAPLPSYPVTVPVRDPRFADAFAERITWLLREGLQVAELTLHPHELGPIRIELALDGDAATLGVVAAHADTRGAIEQALPRLRELLAQQGVQLGGSTVDSGAQHRARDGERAPARRGAAGDEAVTPVGAGGIERTGANRPASRAGRLDVFA